MAERFFKKEEEEEEEEEGYSEPCDEEEEEEEEVEYTRKKVMIRVVSAGQRMSSLVPFMNYSSDSSSSSTSTSYSNSNSGSSSISIGSLRCQADECGVDLRMAKTYHKRHKVCERHAKAAVVLVSGIRQRFCQQCSKFHEISQFDDNKKSCREKLAGHNERRRKTHSDLQEKDKEKPPASSIMNGNLLKAMRYSNYGEKSLQGNSNMKHCRIK